MVFISNSMAALLFTCPTTGYRVQGWIAEPFDQGGQPAAYAPVKCLACQQTHMIDLNENPPVPPGGGTGSASA